VDLGYVVSEDAHPQDTSLPPTMTHRAQRYRRGIRELSSMACRSLVDDDHFKLQLLKDLVPAPGQRAAHYIRLQQTSWRNLRRTASSVRLSDFCWSFNRSTCCVSAMRLRVEPLDLVLQRERSAGIIPDRTELLCFSLLLSPHRIEIRAQPHDVARRVLRLPLPCLAALDFLVDKVVQGDVAHTEVKRLVRADPDDFGDDVSPPCAGDASFRR